MLEIGFKLVDYLVKVIEMREGSLDEYFESYVQPAYEMAEKIYVDYLNIFNTLLEKIKKREDFVALINYLQGERIRNQPLRAKLRAEIQVRFLEPKYQSSANDLEAEYKYDSLGKFEKGAVGLLLGGISSFSDLSHQRTPYLTQHTLLDVLNYMNSAQAIPWSEENQHINQRGKQITISRHGNSKRDDKLIEIVNEQIEALNKAWKDVVEGYAAYKVMAVPTPKGIRNKVIKNKGKS